MTMIIATNKKGKIDKIVIHGDPKAPEINNYVDPNLPVKIQ